MKPIHWFALKTYFSLLVSAGKLEIQQSISELIANSTKFKNERVQTILARHNIPTDQLIEHISGYGCWCNFNNDYRKGQGVVQNEVDELCKILHDGYRCAIIDCRDEGKGNCEPWDVDYQPAGLRSFRHLNTDCVMNNPGDTCAQRACIVESWFANAVLEIFSSSYYIHDSSKKHSNGFNKDWNCVGIQPRYDPNSKAQCCGEFPHRYPYQDLAGQRSCCGQVVYDTMIYDCCDNNYIAVSC